MRSGLFQPVTCLLLLTRGSFARFLLRSVFFDTSTSMTLSTMRSINAATPSLHQRRGGSSQGAHNGIGQPTSLPGRLVVRLRVGQRLEVKAWLIESIGAEFEPLVRELGNA